MANASQALAQATGDFLSRVDTLAFNESSGESTFVRFSIHLPSRGPVQFGVAVYGEETP
jgi:hypothetical protein